MDSYNYYNSKNEINEKFEQSLKYISEKTLYNLAKEDGALNNVLSGHSEQCIGMVAETTFFSTRLFIFYVRDQGKTIFSEALEIDINDNNRSYLILSFCNYLAIQFHDVDMVDIFNHYQHKIKTYIEMFNYRTFDSNLADELEGRSFLLIVPHVDGSFCSGMFYFGVGNTTIK